VKRLTQKDTKREQKSDQTARLTNATRKKRNAFGKTAKDTRRPGGKIITFYSYKGGTGRSMALANVAWILASNGKRVLVIDWDLEAPGLHRYFRPFLADQELLQTRGLIDFFAEFVDASRVASRSQEKSSTKETTPWYLPHADLLRFAVAVEYDFDGKGCIDFVPAGRQGPAYGITVSSFHWAEFYEKLGGGVFLEAVKSKLREDYDYILIDSRTGLSDTSGICTVQMPDELAVFFTLNRQSVYGAAATAKSACDQRQKPTGEPGMKAWPIPTRVDNAEKERLDAARSFARETFAPLLWHLNRSERSDYWGLAEVPYLPFYAYEEILATVADPPGQTNSLLASMERLTARITDGKISRNKVLDSKKRQELLHQFSKETPRSDAPQAKVYLSYSRRDMPADMMGEIAHQLQNEAQMNVFWDQLVPPGVKWANHSQSALTEADLVLMFVGEGWLDSAWTKAEMGMALHSGRRIVPVLMADNTTWAKMPKELKEIRGLELRFEPKYRKQSMAELITIGRTVSENQPQPLAVADVDDPQKGRWGGANQRNGRVLKAVVKQESKNWFEVLLTVKHVGGATVARRS